MKQKWTPEIGDKVWIIGGLISRYMKGLEAIRVHLNEYNYSVLEDQGYIINGKTYNVFKTKKNANTAIKKIETILKNPLIDME